MKKKTANWITHIIGIIMMSLGIYMIFIEKPLDYTLLMFGLGVISFLSFNKLGDFFISGLKIFLSRNNNNEK